MSGSWINCCCQGRASQTVAGLAWWPGYLPLNHPHGPFGEQILDQQWVWKFPDVAAKYLTFTYRETKTINVHRDALGIYPELNTEEVIELVVVHRWHRDFGDLQSIAFTFKARGNDDLGNADYAIGWDRDVDGPGGVLLPAPPPDFAPTFYEQPGSHWPTAVITSAILHDDGFKARPEATHHTTLLEHGATRYAAEVGWEFDGYAIPGVPTSFHYVVSSNSVIETTLTDPLTHATLADDSEALLAEVSFNLGGPSPSYQMSRDLTPAYSGFFSGDGAAEFRFGYLTAANAASTYNEVIVARHRNAGGVRLHGVAPAGYPIVMHRQMSAFGAPVADSYERRSNYPAGEWWTWPNWSQAVMSRKTAYRWPAGLRCGNQLPDFDFETIWPFEGQARVAPRCGRGGLLPGEHVFGPDTLRNFALFGDSWGGWFDGSTYFPLIQRPNCCG